ncbi:hypothetical protein CDD82_7266 [Ophiocordyceps australis]|uniref:Major facilitator superfamily (MFS) profile domain-containing protein n=1 Tax=Ophiocordyceps australis TaxID=1399860 RepID=A0A2C5YL14_9HYPO|nr:hypothetical protein CDD82_7266 [Ophiocordyceps australis]
MLQRMESGTWLPSWVPESTVSICMVLMLCSVVQSTTNGYDGSMLNGLNILPSYTDYFKLTPATTGLNTASVFIGGFFGPIFGGFACNRLGRRPTIFWAAVINIAAVVLQGAAQNIAMFAVARIVLGFGNGVAGVAASIYLSETFPSRWRAWGVGLLNNFYYVGALIAGAITLVTGRWQSTWAWRLPSLVQAAFSVVCLVLLPFVPESPRWLVRQERFDDARLIVAKTNARGDAATIYREMIDRLNWEAKQGKTLSVLEIIKTPSARKRVLIGGSVGPFSCVAGNIIASYYLGSELRTAGITETQDQLKANLVLNAWCLVCCLAGTQLAARWGRKPTALLSQTLLITCLYTIGFLSKRYQDDAAGASTSLIYGNVAVMFLFQGFYSVAWTPLLFLYPPEVLSYQTRASGVAFSQYSLNALALLLVLVMPIGLDSIGWKMYTINASWDIVVLGLITKGKTLEEIDGLFEGQVDWQEEVEVEHVGGASLKARGKASDTMSGFEK